MAWLPHCWWNNPEHYNDVIIGGSQIANPTIVYSTVYSGIDQTKSSKLRVNGLCTGNSPVTDEFPAQRASNAENVSISWRLMFTRSITSQHHTCYLNDLCWNTNMKPLGVNTDHVSADLLDDSTPTWFNLNLYDDTLTWRHFLQHWPFVRGIHAISGFTPQRTGIRRLDIFFVVIMNKLLNNQSSCRWFKNVWALMSLPCVTSMSLQWDSGDWFNIKMLSYQNRNSHFRGKAYLHNGISYNAETTYFFYWTWGFVMSSDNISKFNTKTNPVVPKGGTEFRIEKPGQQQPWYWH